MKSLKIIKDRFEGQLESAKDTIKEILNELRQENNFFRFNLEEQKRNFGTQKLKKNKASPNKNKSIKLNFNSPI